MLLAASASWKLYLFNRMVDMGGGHYLDNGEVTSPTFLEPANLLAREIAGGIRAIFEDVADDLVGSTVYRVLGENNNPLGQSWTRVDPSAVLNYRDAAGLPALNTGRFVIQETITDSTGVTVRLALPLYGNAGGLDEVLIPDAGRRVQINCVSGVNPEY